MCLQTCGPSRSMILLMPHDAPRLALALSYVIEGGWLDDEFIDSLQRLRAVSNSNRRIAEWYSTLVQMEIFVPAKSSTTARGGCKQCKDESCGVALSSQ